MHESSNLARDRFSQLKAYTTCEVLRVGWIGLALVVVACGRIGFDPQASSSSVDGGDLDGDVVDDAALPDSTTTVGPDATAIADLGPFSAPLRIAALTSTAQEDDPSATGDLLELYFNSDRAGGDDIWLSKRNSTAEAWPAPVVVAELSTPSEDSTPQVAADGLTLWLSSDRPGGQGGRDIWVSTRASRTVPWATPTIVPELSSPLNETGPSPIPSLLMMVINSNRAGGAGAFDVYLATRTSTSATWSTPAPIVEINTIDDDGGASLSGQGLNIFFSSTRPGGMGGLDLYSASRPSTADPFGTPILLTELNSTAGDTDSWISPDGRVLLFSSTRDGDKEIYQAVR